MRYLACAGVFIVYVLIGAIMGWKHGGGLIPALIFFAAEVFVWRALAPKKSSTQA